MAAPGGGGYGASPMESRELSRRALCTALGALGVTRMAQAAEVARAPFVLVHGSWHGGWCWKDVAQALRARGHAVFAPTLTGLAERAGLATPEVGLSVHVRDVVDLLAAEDLRGAVLVGHSYAGLVITGAAAAAPARVGRLVYLDAVVPEPGQSGFDLLRPDYVASWRKKAQEKGEGWRVPPMLSAKALGIEDPALAKEVEARLTPMPIATWDEKLQFDARAVAAVPRAYVRCKRFPGFGPTYAKLQQAGGWTLRELDAGHDAMLTAPGALAALLLELAAPPR